MNRHISSDDRSNELKEKSQRIRPPSTRSFAAYGTKWTRQSFPTHALASRTQFSDTTRHGTARHGTIRGPLWSEITIVRNSLRHRVRVRKSLLSRHTPAVATMKTTRRCSTCTCVVNAHTRRPDIDRTARKSATYSTRETRTTAPTGFASWDLS